MKMVLSYMNFVLHLEVKPKIFHFVFQFIKTRMAFWVHGLFQFKYGEKSDYVTKLDILINGSIKNGTNVQAIDNTLKDLSPSLPRKCP